MAGFAAVVFTVSIMGQVQPAYVHPEVLSDDACRTVLKREVVRLGTMKTASGAPVHDSVHGECVRLRGRLDRQS